MKRIKRLLRAVALVLSAVLVLITVGGWISLHHTEWSARRKIAGIETYAVPVDQIAIPETAQIVGLGEASHGNAVFQELKLSVFARLVREYGYHAFALELDFGEGLLVNDYIQGGEGTAEEIAACLSFPIYHTKEMAALFQWMRDYNANQAPENRLRFYGFDMQNTMESAKRVMAFCEQQSLSGLEAEQAAVAELTRADSSLGAPRALAIRQALGRIGEAIAAKQTDGLDENTEMTLQAIATLSQAMGTFELLGDSYSDYRDGCMANNVAWIVRREEALGHGKVMIAAHNGHIARSGQGSTPMGQLLAERFAGGYYAMGTDFFTAEINISTSSMITDVPERGIHRFCSADPLAYQARFMPDGQYALDFSALPPESETLYRLISSPIPMANVGEGYMGLWYLFPETAYRPKQTPINLYDAMIYVDHAKPTEVWN